MRRDSGGTDRPGGRVESPSDVRGPVRCDQRRVHRGRPRAVPGGRGREAVFRDRGSGFRVESCYGVGLRVQELGL